MTNMHDSFADLKALEEDIWDAPAKPVSTCSHKHTESIGNVAIPGFVERCPKCRGTGSYGRVSSLGHSACTKCKGTGKLQFRTAPEARAKARVSSAARAQRKQAENIIAFGEQYPVEAKWLSDSGSSFATSLTQAIAKYGHLTENQLAAVRKCIARDEDKAAGAGEWIAAHQAEHAWLVSQAEAGNELANDLLTGQYGLLKRSFLTDNQLALVQRKMAAEAPATDSDLDVSGLKGYYAVPDGDTRLKLCVRKPGKNSRYHGWTFVDDGAAYGSRRTYGKQAPGGKYRGDVQDALRAILADPLEAQKAYGKLTGVCGHCGRMLEDEASVAAGIGPICAAKF